MEIEREGEESEWEREGKRERKTERDEKSHDRFCFLKEQKDTTLISTHYLENHLMYVLGKQIRKYLAKDFLTPS